MVMLAIGGCSTGGLVSGNAAVTTTRATEMARQAQRESALQSTWRGQRYEALLGSYGTPQLMMNVLGYRPLKTSLLVYGVVDQDAKCIDAFTMVKHQETGEWIVADYFCR
jgi:hypothetical protein